jgi:hypothetical protein
MKHTPLPGRQELVHQLRDRLLRESAPRLQLGFIVSLAGLAAFLSSVATLKLGVPWMAVRYPLAVVCGYATFFLLIRWWIAWQRRFDEAALNSTPDAVDVLNVTDLAGLRLPTRGAPDVPLFAAGRGGGAGASVNWGTASTAASPPSPAAKSGFDLDLDLDDAWWAVIAVVCVAGGAVAIGYVVYAAPVLLAEVALDAAVVSTLYRRLRQEDVSHWAMTVLRRTWMSALALTVLAAIGGYALQQMAPEAQSIGGVVRALRE